jgi:glyceraldehyde 3-phosphate dehydrogenase
MTRIALNGFGRIGRLFFKRALEASDIDIVAVNDLGDGANLAYLLQYDTVYGKFGEPIAYREGTLQVRSRSIPFFQEKDPAKLPWGKLQVDIVVEATGVFESYETARVHLEAGAKRVVITAPAKDEDGPLGTTVLCGVNEGDIAKTAITSNGSCTTNATSPIIAALHGTIGVERAVLSTVHAYTATQSLVDGPVKGNDFRRGRAAAQNIVLSTTGAAIAVARGIPALAGKFDGIAMRVPVPSGSVADITMVASRPTTVEEVNGALREAAASPRWQGILTVTESQVVSSDIVGQPYGAIADLSFTKVVDGTLVKVLSWYDNEAGYVATLVRHVLLAANCL